MGKKRINLDRDKVRYYASLGHPVSDIAVLMCCSEDTIGRRYMDDVRAGRTMLKNSLRRKQIELAIRGDGHADMLKHLGKFYLDQRDSLAIEHSGSENKPPIQIEQKVNYKNLSTEELISLEQLLEKASRDGDSN